MTASVRYEVGGKLPNIVDYDGAFTITSLNKLSEKECENTYARWTFTAKDLSKKCKVLDFDTMKYVNEHPTVVGWIDEQGRWFS
jgi:hypothetical protein